MASDAVIGPRADTFLGNLTMEQRDLWWAEVYPRFLANPQNEDTIFFPEAGEDDGLPTVAFPFLVFFRFLNPEVLAIANITWAPPHG